MKNSDLKTKHLAWHHCTCAVSETGHHEMQPLQHVRPATTQEETTTVR